MLLQMSGHDTCVAHDGMAALEASERFRPDVVLLDLGLPKMNGIDVCRQIREQPWGTTIVILALTGWGRQDDQQRSMEAGFTGHLVKPVDYGDLQRLLARLLRDRQSQA